MLQRPSNSSYAPAQRLVIDCQRLGNFISSDIRRPYDYRLSVQILGYFGVNQVLPFFIRYPFIIDKKGFRSYKAMPSTPSFFATRNSFTLLMFASNLILYPSAVSTGFLSQAAAPFLPFLELVFFLINRILSLVFQPLKGLRQLRLCFRLLWPGFRQTFNFIHANTVYGGYSRAP